MISQHKGIDCHSEYPYRPQWSLDSFPEKTITQILCEMGFVGYLNLTSERTKLVEETTRRLYLELSGKEPTIIGNTLYLYPFPWHARLGAIAKAIAQA